jgi:hypothetical protein
VIGFAQHRSHCSDALEAQNQILLNEQSAAVTSLAYEIASQIRHARSQLLSARDAKQMNDRLATVLLCSSAASFLAIAVATGDQQFINLCRLLVHS